MISYRREFVKLTILSSQIECQNKSLIVFYYIIKKGGVYYEN